MDFFLIQLNSILIGFKSMKNEYLTVEQIQKLDKTAIEKFGMPSLSLMENAGKAVAKEVICALEDNKKSIVSVFCGLGNNAGDGFVIARHLINFGVDVRIYLIGNASNLKKDAFVNYKILRNLSFPIIKIVKVNNEILKNIKISDITIDAIFGVGLNRLIGEPFKSIIESINENSKKIIAVDIPSGLDGNSGEIYGTCVKAKTTITFSAKKIGFKNINAKQYLGKIKVVDIGIPRQSLNYVI